jgi:hypothetical protein
MTPMLEIKLSGSLAAVGFVTAVVCAVLYFMRLPIFAETTVSWIFVIGLIALGIGALAMILRSIWSDPS